MLQWSGWLCYWFLDFFGAKNRIEVKLRSIRSPQVARNKFIKRHHKCIAKNAQLKDVGCGSQRYNGYCGEGCTSKNACEYISAERKIIREEDISTAHKSTRYNHETLTIISDAWNIAVKANSFNAAPCTEVLAHLLYLLEVVNEGCRILKPGSKFILTVPGASLSHMDPYYFYSGLSDRWIESELANAGLSNLNITPVGDYYRWMALELAKKIITSGVVVELCFLPSFIWHLLQKSTSESVNTLCIG